MSLSYEEAIQNLSRDKWSKLNCDQKLETLQGIENEYAKQFGREPRPVVGKYVEDNRLGWSDLGGNKIYINTHYLHANEETKSDYMLHLNTVLHEGRHFYQKDAIEGKIEGADPQQVAEWKHNLSNGNYIDGRKFPQEYFNQPVERDARDFAEKESYKVIQERSQLNNYKDSPAYNSKQKAAQQNNFTPTKNGFDNSGKITFRERMNKSSKEVNPSRTNNIRNRFKTGKSNSKPKIGDHSKPKGSSGLLGSNKGKEHSK